jgi:hypothetical protein
VVLREPHSSHAHLCPCLACADYGLERMAREAAMGPRIFKPAPAVVKQHAVGGSDDEASGPEAEAAGSDSGG